MLREEKCKNYGHTPILQAPLATVPVQVPVTEPGTGSGTGTGFYWWFRYRFRYRFRCWCEIQFRSGPISNLARGATTAD